MIINPIISEGRILSHLEVQSYNKSVRYAKNNKILFYEKNVLIIAGHYYF